MKFDITDGIYAIKLENVSGGINGGESRWDCQFRHRNLTIESGHTYRITYSVKPSTAVTCTQSWVICPTTTRNCGTATVKS